MTRIAVVFIVACVLLGAGFYAWKSGEERKAASGCNHLEVKQYLEGSMVFVVQDIQNGSVIPANALEEKVVPQEKIPKTAITKSVLVIGKKALQAIKKGHFMYLDDVDLGWNTAPHRSSKTQP